MTDQVTRGGFFAQGGRLVHGRVIRKELARRRWWHRLLGLRHEPGVCYEYGSLTLAQAAAAFEALCARSGASVSLETVDGARIDFLPARGLHDFVTGRGASSITLDVWFSNAAIGDQALTLDRPAEPGAVDLSWGVGRRHRSLRECARNVRMRKGRTREVEICAHAVEREVAATRLVMTAFCRLVSGVRPPGVSRTLEPKPRAGKC